MPLRKQSTSSSKCCLLNSLPTFHARVLDRNGFMANFSPGSCKLKTSTRASTTTSTALVFHTSYSCVLEVHPSRVDLERKRNGGLFPSTDAHAAVVQLHLECRSCNIIIYRVELILQLNAFMKDASTYLGSSHLG